MTPEYIHTLRELMEYEAARKENLYYSQPKEKWILSYDFV